MTKTVLRVKRWEEFQHYRDRDPVWIKVYGRLLDDADFLALPEAAQGQLVKLWLLASRCQNNIPDDSTYLKHALHTNKLYTATLVECGFLERSASTPLAKPERDASPHARPRARGETETETETDSSSSARERFVALAESTGRTGWRETLAGWEQGMGYIGGRAAHAADIEAGLAEYLADNADLTFSPRHVVTYVQGCEHRRTQSAPLRVESGAKSVGDLARAMLSPEARAALDGVA